MPRRNVRSPQFNLLKQTAVTLALPCALALLAGNATSLAQEIERLPHPEPPRIDRNIDPMRPPALVERDKERVRRAFGLDAEKKPHLGLRTGEVDLVEKPGHALRNGRAPFLLLPQDAPIHLHETLGNLPPAERGSADYYRWVERSLNRDTHSPQHLLPEDGIFSEQTRHAVRLFQARHGLATDGLIGDKTELALERVIGPTDWLSPTHHYKMPSYLADQPIANLLTTPPAPPRRTTFLDVQNRNGRVSVSVYDEDSLYRSILDPRLSTIQNRPVASSAELAGLLAGADTVIHSGDPLPKEWNSVVDDNATRLRHSNQSPKRLPTEYVHAAQLLEQRATPDSVRVFSALPHEADRTALTRQLTSMGLNRREVDGWAALQDQMQRLQQDSGYTFEPASVEGITRELTAGKHNTIVLIAHHEDGMTILPNGERLSDQDFARLTRAVAPDRNLILISCETGTVNGRKTSLGEVLLKNKLAANVAAPPDPVSGQDVPGMLRDFLIGRKTIREVFSKLGFITEDQPPPIGWQTDWEGARLTMLP